MIEARALDFWLLDNGFDSNPFASKEADFEVMGDQSRMVDYFVRAFWFEQILGEARQPRSAILSARRGFGKSASRLMVEYECRHGRLAGQVLAVAYTNFERAIAAQHHSDNQAVQQAHMRSITENCTLSLMNYLKEQPAQIANLGYGGSYRLVALLAGYTNLFDPFQLDETLRQTNADEKVLNSQTFLEAAQTGSLTNLLDRANLGQERAWLELLGQAAIYNQPPPPLNLSLIYDFYRLAQMVGLSAVYILVDRVDELPETAANPAAGAELLRPLLADLRLMEVPGLAFKFFLPNEISALLFASPEIRADRLTRYEIHWSEAQLVNFLHNRLLAYSSNSGLNSLAPFCETGFADEIDQELSGRAEGSPRNLLRLGELLINEHCQGADINGPLRRAEMEQAYQKLRGSLQEEQAAYNISPSSQLAFDQAALEQFPSQNHQTGLYLDNARRQVWREGNLIEPGPIGQEYTLLEYLYQNAGRAISKDELLRAIYGNANYPEVSEEALAQMISRLRKKIEPAPKSGQTTYIITVPRFGYKLENRSRD